MIVDVTEVDPICAMQACFDGYSVVSAYFDGNVTPDGKNINSNLLKKYDLVVTTTGNINVLDKHMLTSLKSDVLFAILGTLIMKLILISCTNMSGMKLNLELHKIIRGKNDYLILLGEGRLVNLALATGHPSRVMDGSFCNQVLAQIFLYKNKYADNPKNDMINISTLPRELDEDVARRMVIGFGGTMTKLTSEQQEYISVEKNGPFKGDTYKY